VIRTIAIERLSLFRRWLPTDVYLWTKAVLLALIAVQIGRLLWAVVTPVGPLGAWQPAQARLLSEQAQAAVLGAVDPFFRNGPPVAASAAETSTIDLQLFGVRENRGSGAGAAIIGAPDGEQTSFIVGEEVAPGIKLAAVFFDYVVLDRGGAQDKLYMDPPESAAASAGAGPAPGPVPAGAAEQSLNAASARQAFAFAPRSRGGQVTGVMVSPGLNQALFASAGFQAGDVIVAVNGARITSAADLAQLQSSLSPGARLSLTVERGAQTVPIALNLAGN
jgi:general secretion pathway protein C